MILFLSVMNIFFSSQTENVHVCHPAPSFITRYLSKKQAGQKLLSKAWESICVSWTHSITDEVGGDFLCNIIMFCRNTCGSEWGAEGAQDYIWTELVTLISGPRVESAVIVCRASVLGQPVLWAQHVNTYKDSLFFVLTFFFLIPSKS